MNTNTNTNTNTSTYYYNHTSKHGLAKLGYIPLASLAVKLDGDKIKYGISICHSEDNFSRKVGRVVAQARAENGFGEMPIPEAHKDTDPKEICLKALYNRTTSLTAKPRRWKKRLNQWNKAGNSKNLSKFLNPNLSQETRTPISAIYTNIGA